MHLAASENRKPRTLPAHTAGHLTSWLCTITFITFCICRFGSFALAHPGKPRVDVETRAYCFDLWAVLRTPVRVPVFPLSSEAVQVIQCAGRVSIFIRSHTVFLLEGRSAFFLLSYGVRRDCFRCGCLTAPRRFFYSTLRASCRFGEVVVQHASGKGEQKWAVD